MSTNTDKAAAGLKPIKRVLISVNDKSGIADLARVLWEEFGAEIISTGGTATALREAGFVVTDVSILTQSPEMYGGRVKTLHPDVFGPILFKRDDLQDLASAKQYGHHPIDMVVVNLYPFEKTIAKDGATIEEAIENIDIGGPSMIRAGGKNYSGVAVVTDVRDYGHIIQELRENDGSLTAETRAELLVKAFERTAEYDSSISRYLAQNLLGGERKLSYDNKNAV